jgi:hypothetical protein
MATDDKEYDLDTAEGMHNYVVDKVREGLTHERTKEDVQQARTRLLDQYDDATAFHLKDAEKCGAEIGDMKMTAEFWFNKELGAWELENLRSNQGIKLKHPIKRIYARFNADLGDPKEHKEDYPDSCECFACEALRGVECDGRSD